MAWLAIMIEKMYERKKICVTEIEICAQIMLFTSVQHVACI